MSDVYHLSGSYNTKPLGGSLSGDPSLSSFLDESVVLVNKTLSYYELTTDPVVSVNLCGLSAVNVLVVKTIGGKVRVRITSSDGSTQSIPVDSLLVIHSASVDITAIDVQRVAGITTQVRIFLGER